MVTDAKNLPAQSRPFEWFLEFLKEELAPYPGRGALVARMVIAATIVMILTMTFRIPYGAFGALYALTISRESPQETIKAVKTIVIAFALGAACELILASLFLGDPFLRLIWIIATLFIMFYALSAMTNYTAAARFGYMLAITIPLWNSNISNELKVERTLWAVGTITLASLITLLIELVFAAGRPLDDFTRSIAERLDSVEELLKCYMAENGVDKKTEKKITRLAMVGTSRLRRILQRSTYSQRYIEEMGAVLGLVGRLVDIGANLIHLSIRVSDDERKRIGRLAEQIAKIRADLLNGRVPELIEFDNESESSPAIPLLREMERSVSLIPQVFTGSQSLSAFAPSSVGDPPSTLFVPDALSNSDHFKFGLKGCLAASLCYIIFNALFWPGISTSITTCFVTALTTIGASHQKQFLRITGAITGGVVLGIGSQVFILPQLDSIGDFTLLFIAVTIVAAWFATSSPRLSYFGVQIAVAFYLVNLQEFKIQTSLEVARDRVLGILLGISMMWLVFDQLWGPPALVGMKKTFISTLRLLAQLATIPLSADPRVAIEPSFSLRETINTNLDKVRTLADGVLFEFGPSRQQDLTLRRQIVRWQPQLRMLFLMQIAWLKYRLQIPGFELPEAIRLAQQEFDNRLARMLEGMADRLEGKEADGKEGFEDLFERLEQTTQTCCSQVPQERLTASLQSFLPLSRRIKDLAISLNREFLNHKDTKRN